MATEPQMPAWLIRNRNFVLLWGGYFVAAVGDNLNDLGQLSLLDALQGEDSVRLRALMMFGLFVPFLVLGPLAGWCADRFSRRWTMIGADVIRAAIVVNFATLIPWLRAIGCGPYSVMLSQMSLGLLAAFFSPARQALLPGLVRTDQLVRANAFISGMGPIGAMLGFMLGGYIVDTPVLGVVWNFRINGLTYLSSALLVLLILVPHRQHMAPTAATTILGPLKEGFAYVRAHRRIWQLILLCSLFWGAAGAVFSCVPAVVKHVVSQQYADVGKYQALPTLGMIAGSALMALLGTRVRVQTSVVSGLLIAALGLALLTVVFVGQLGGVLAIVSLVTVGFGGALLLVTVNATLQRFVPDSRRGRVFGVSDMTTMGAMVLAVGALGLAPISNLDRYVPLVFGIVTALLAGAGVLAWVVYARGARTAVRPQAV